MRPPQRRVKDDAPDLFYGNRVKTLLYETSGVIGRIRGFQIGENAGSNSDLENAYGYSTAGRFETLSSGRDNNSASRTFRYGYLPDSALVNSLGIDGTAAFAQTRTFEAQRDLVTSVETGWTSSVYSRHAYTYDERGQRTTSLQSGNAFADYGDAINQRYTYNGRGEVVAATGYLGTSLTDTTKPLPSRRYEYAYDAIGNRQSSNRTGLSDLRDDYTVNALNQYVAKENSTVPLSGAAEAGSVVAVSGRNVSALRQGRFWADEVPVANVLAPWTGQLGVYAAKFTGGGELLRLDSRTARIPAFNQTFTYDLDGNPLSDGLWDYQWDAANRLVRLETTVAARTAGFPHRVLQFTYDYMGRRVKKRVSVWNTSTSTFELQTETKFLYDGWSLLAEYTLNSQPSSPLTLVRSYTWGLDIARSLTGAGGVGALVQIADHASGKTFIPAYDGNGNVTALVNADTGAIAAAYEYSPFGEQLRAESFDPVVADQPFRFSTKFTDAETGLVYYGYRFYDPRLGRFVGRDPIEEHGGLNLYGFCGNNAVNRWDLLGMQFIIDVDMGRLSYGCSPGEGWTMGEQGSSGGLNYMEWIRWDSTSGLFQRTTSWEDFSDQSDFEEMFSNGQAALDEQRRSQEEQLNREIGQYQEFINRGTQGMSESAANLLREIRADLWNSSERGAELGINFGGGAAGAVFSPNSPATVNSTGASGAGQAAWSELMAFRSEISRNMPDISKKWSWSFLCGETAQAHIDALSSINGTYWTVNTTPYWRGSAAIPGIVTGHAVILFDPTVDNPFPAHVIDPFDVPLSWKSAMNYFTTYAGHSEWKNGTAEVYNRDYWIQDKPYDNDTPTFYVPGFPP